jgi:hypothetical protein
MKRKKPLTCSLRPGAFLAKEATNRDKLMQQELERYLRHAAGPLARRTGPVYAPTRHR